MSLRQSFIQTQDLPAHLQSLTKDGTPLALSHAAQNSDRTPEDLTLLARHDNPHTRYGVAVNPNTPPELLIELADDIGVATHRGERIFEFIVQNSNAPAQALESVYAKRPLFGEFGDRTIERIFNHPNASEALREKVAQDPVILYLTKIAASPGNNLEP